MARTKKKELADIPKILERAIDIMSRDINRIHRKGIPEKGLPDKEARRILQYCATLATVYKDYRIEAAQLAKEMKGKSAEEIEALLAEEEAERQKKASKLGAYAKKRVVVEEATPEETEPEKEKKKVAHLD